MYHAFFKVKICLDVMNRRTIKIMFFFISAYIGSPMLGANKKTQENLRFKKNLKSSLLILPNIR